VCLECVVEEVLRLLRLRCWKRDNCLHRWNAREQLSSGLYLRHRSVCVYYPRLATRTVSFAMKLE
jgi:hypothetical protein